MALGGDKPSHQWREKIFQLLNNEIEAILSEIPAKSDFLLLIKESLNETVFRNTNNNSPYPWPLLPLLVSEAISGYYEDTIPAAASLCLLKSSAEIFDDTEDADSSMSLSSKYGPSLAINIATLLLILAEKAITRLKKRAIKPQKVIQVMHAINSFYITACVGQHLDLSFNKENKVTENHYLQVMKMKSATTTGCACHIGALLANANKRVLDQFTEFGFNLGMASQIANDLMGCIRKDDILKTKIILPIIYALSQSDCETRNYLENIFIKRSDPNIDESKIKGILFQSGAIQYATIKMEYFKQQAGEILDRIKKTGVYTQKLDIFLK